MVLDAPPVENKAPRILIIDTAWLGDVVFTTVLIGSVKTAWPECELDVLVAPRGEQLLSSHSQINRLWVYDKSGAQKSARSLWNLASQLRRRHYSITLTAHPSFRSRLLTGLIGAPVRVGFKGFGARFCFTHRVTNDLSLEPDHGLRRTNLVRALKPEIEPGPLSVPISREAHAAADDFFSQIGERPCLGLVPGSAWRTKRWPVNYYAELAVKWIREEQGSVIVVGGEAESGIIREIRRRDERNIHPAVGYPLQQVGALLSRCTAVVGNDTGVTLLAVAAGSPKVIALYGCTQVNHRFLPPHRAIEAGVPCCLPRTGHGAKRCRWSDDPWCMTQIKVDQVWEAITSDSQ